MAGNTHELNDHDLLITIAAQLDQVKQDVTELKDKLVDEKMDKSTAEKTLNDHETRIRKIERWALLGIGGLAVIQFISLLYVGLHGAAR